MPPAAIHSSIRGCHTNAISTSPPSARRSTNALAVASLIIYAPSFVPARTPRLRPTGLKRPSLAHRSPARTAIRQNR